MTPEERALIKALINERVRATRKLPKRPYIMSESWLSVPVKLFPNRTTHNRKGLDYQ